MKLEGHNFINKLEAFNKAAAELSAAWVGLADDKISEVPNKLYPFKGSFDEVAGEVKEWVEDTTKRLKAGTREVFIVGEICIGESLEVSWRDDEKIVYFQSEDQAEAEIKEMLEDVADAVKNGDMIEEYDRENYVILPATLVEGETLYFQYEGENFKMGLTDENKTLI